MSVPIDPAFTEITLTGVLAFFMWYWFSRIDSKVDAFEKRLRKVEDKVNVYTLEEKSLNNPTSQY